MKQLYLSLQDNNDNDNKFTDDNDIQNKSNRNFRLKHSRNVKINTL